MKKTRFLILFFAIAIIAISCKKDDAPSFVDDYNAPLTQEKGTKHSGDYFPIEEGYLWNYSGIEELKGEIIYSGGGVNETEPIEESSPVYSSILVEPITSVTLASGNYMLYPVKEAYPLSYSYRYFEKKDDGIYFRAFSSVLDEIVEVKNPTFIKIPLIVGDSWETQPAIDLNLVLSENEEVSAGGKIDAAINCKTYVIGQEGVSWNDQNVNPVRLDQISEAKITMSFNEEGTTGTIDMNLKTTNILYLLEDVGIIKQGLDMEMTMNFTASIEGQKGTMKMTLNSNGELNLDSYNVAGTSVKKQIRIINDNGNEIKIEGNKVYQKVVNKGIRVLRIVKGAYTL